MLRTLILKNFILTEFLELELAAGFGVLTGETGAGKSILLDALQCVTGARAEVGMIRQQHDKAEVSALFSLADDHPILPRLAEWEIDGGEEILLRRVLDRGGRHKAFINGTPVTVAQLAQIGSELLEIHGQHDSMQLMRPAHQRLLLDSFAEQLPRLAELQGIWQTWQALSRQLQAAAAQQEQLLQQREELLLRQQDLAAIASAEEWAAINRRHQQLANVHELQSQAAIALQLLADNEYNIDTLLFAAAEALAGVLKTDAGLADIHAMLHSAQNEVGEATRMLRHYLDKLESDPSALEEVEAHMRLQMDCARKYRCTPETLEALRQDTDRALAALTEGLDVGALTRKTAEAEAQYAAVAEQLSQARQAAARQLSAAVNQRLPALGLKQAELVIQVLSAEAGPTGKDNIDFLIQGLAGSGLRPMAKVVSGGELSRLALAIFLALHGGVAKTFVFDEVDAGIGGAVADAVGHMLSELACQQSEGQILCVTHLPQVASCASWHAQVEKILADDEAMAKSTVRVLDTQAARIEEIARMLGGRTITSTTREHAKEMLHAGVVR